MGVDHFVVQERIAKLSVGGVENPVGIIGNIGKANTGMRAQFDQASARVRKGSSPRAVLAFGYGSRRAQDARVIAWEKSMSRTNDQDWDRLPTLGIARRGADGGLVLCPSNDPERPMTLDEAVLSDICDQNGIVADSFRRGRTLKNLPVRGLFNERMHIHRRSGSDARSLREHHPRVA
jgi:hypothetical protein